MMFFVTGASGSGKSAGLPGLRAALPTMDWRDFCGQARIGALSLHSCGPD
jgi:hypothetical protein